MKKLSFKYHINHVIYHIEMISLIHSTTFSVKSYQFKELRSLFFDSSTVGRQQHKAFKRNVNEHGNGKR